MRTTERWESRAQARPPRDEGPRRKQAWQWGLNEEQNGCDINVKHR